MSTRRNLARNPSFVRSLRGWSHSNPAWSVATTQATVPPEHGRFFVGTSGALMAWDTGGSNGAYFAHEFEPSDEPVLVHAELKAAGVEGDTPIRLGLELFAAGQRTGTSLGETVTLTPGQPYRFTLDRMLPAGTDRVVLIFYRQGHATAPSKVVFSNVLLELGTTGTYFDGALPTTGEFAYGWDGDPYESTSYRMDTIDLVHPWTRTWWDFLPNAYKEADAAMNPELGGFPLLRWMNGIGQLGGEMRQLSDDLWAGKYADPATVPDGSLRWLAMMLGLSAQHRNQTADVLRERLTTLTNVGRSAAGTRAMIAESAKAFLTPGAQARVEPSSQRPHVLIMYVRAYEVPNDDLPGLARKVNAAGFVPAGHIVECKPVVTTWDDWEATAGKTWTDKEANIRTWNESDSAGVVLE